MICSLLARHIVAKQSDMQLVSIPTILPIGTALNNSVPPGNL